MAIVESQYFLDLKYDLYLVATYKAKVRNRVYLGLPGAHSIFERWKDKGVSRFTDMLGEDSQVGEVYTPNGWPGDRQKKILAGVVGEDWYRGASAIGWRNVLNKLVKVLRENYRNTWGKHPTILIEHPLLTLGSAKEPASSFEELRDFSTEIPDFIDIWRYPEPEVAGTLDLTTPMGQVIACATERTFFAKLADALGEEPQAVRNAFMALYYPAVISPSPWGRLVQACTVQAFLETAPDEKRAVYQRGLNFVRRLRKYENSIRRI